MRCRHFVHPLGRVVEPPFKDHSLILRRQLLSLARGDRSKLNMYPASHRIDTRGETLAAFRSSSNSLAMATAKTSTEFKLRSSEREISKWAAKYSGSTADTDAQIVAELVPRSLHVVTSRETSFATSASGRLRVRSPNALEMTSTRFGRCRARPSRRRTNR